jgi:hypothetical protein
VYAGWHPGTKARPLLPSQCVRVREVFRLAVWRAPGPQGLPGRGLGAPGRDRPVTVSLGLTVTTQAGTVRRVSLSVSNKSVYINKLLVIQLSDHFPLLHGDRPGRHSHVKFFISDMGKKDKKKKQGRGAEKTLAKTAKNAAKRERKDRKAQGAEEEDIEVILNNLAKLDRERVAVTEVFNLF